MKILISFLTRTWHLVGNALNVHVLNVHVTLYNKMSSFAFGYLHDFLQGLKKNSFILIMVSGGYLHELCGSYLSLRSNGVLDLWLCSKRLTWLLL